MNPAPCVCVACSIFRHELDALRGQLGLDIEVRYLGSMLHMAPKHLEIQLASILAEERARGRDVVLAYGDCCPGMLDFQAEPGHGRTIGINCCELVLGRERYRQLRKEGIFFLMPEWALRWRQSFEKELGLRPETARELMREMHTRLLYLDTGQVPVPREALEQASVYTGLPWDILSVDLEPLRASLLEAIHQAMTHDQPR